jgi:hypothetical protein
MRNRPNDVSDLLGLPDHVIPFAGLAVGWPALQPEVSLRLALEATVHIDCFDEGTIEDQVSRYDDRRASVQPYSKQRSTDLHGVAERYTWSEDKARQYSRPERADFGRFVRRKGFNLD